jgi:hypothetical protein
VIDDLSPSIDDAKRAWPDREPRRARRFAKEIRSDDRRVVHGIALWSVRGLDDQIGTLLPILGST